MTSIAGPKSWWGAFLSAWMRSFCADLKMFRLITGEPCDGNSCMDFLKNHVVELDFDRGILVIAERDPGAKQHERRGVSR